MDVWAPKQDGYRRRNTNKLTIDTDNLVQYRDLQKDFADAVTLKILTHRSKKGNRFRERYWPVDLGREVEVLVSVFLHRKDWSLRSPGSSPDVTSW